MPDRIYPVKTRNGEYNCSACSLFNWPLLCKKLTGNQFALQGCELNGTYYYWDGLVPCTINKELIFSIDKLHNMKREEIDQLRMEKATKALQG
ncbi:MAG: hypothetical protein FWE50_02875 [Alphaproteobacteria bacterium]|nr:hypothetical protein [Alphaproteobacteria bacterium]